MGSASQITVPPPVISMPGEQARWYAVHTRCRHEKRVDTRLRQSGIETLLPLVQEIHYWSDRRQMIDVPLFACYTFAYMDAASSARLRVLKTMGVLGLVGGQNGAIPIPAWEIEQVKRVLEQRLALAPHPFLNIGQRVRVRGGALQGLEGILTCIKNTTTLVISVEPIQRSISVPIQGYDVEPV